ncbi:MAG: hypothetical protein K8F25_06375 [Fimbriimonadaceae bacterium]|nr:hypothetical protein [Alphaproteobacteria bacterium]
MKTFLLRTAMWVLLLVSGLSICSSVWLFAMEKKAALSALDLNAAVLQQQAKSSFVLAVPISSANAELDKIKPSLPIGKFIVMQIAQLELVPALGLPILLADLRFKQESDDWLQVFARIRLASTIEQDGGALKAALATIRIFDVSFQIGSLQLVLPSAISNIFSAVLDIYFRLFGIDAVDGELAKALEFDVPVQVPPKSSPMGDSVVTMSFATDKKIHVKLTNFKAAVLSLGDRLAVITSH